MGQDLAKNNYYTFVAKMLEASWMPYIEIATGTEISTIFAAKTV
jgi:hypothetical protein